MKILFTILILGSTLCIKAQLSISVTNAVATGLSDAWSNDHLIPDPVIGPFIWDNQACTLNNFIPGFLGNDYGTVCFVHAIERGDIPGPHEVSSYIGSRAFINGDNSQMVQIKWKNTGANYATTDGHDAMISSFLSIYVEMTPTGVPPGTPVRIFWWYDIFGGGSTAHEDAMIQEDTVSVSNMLWLNGNSQLNGQFDFASPGGLAGWNERKNVSGTFRAVAGTPFTFGLTTTIDLGLHSPAGPGGFGFGIDQNDGIFRGTINFAIYAESPLPVNNTDDEMLTLFSLDIGSDSELSDPQQDGNEYFDPGDLYRKDLAGPYPFVSPYLDDNMIFGYDPDPKPYMPVNPAPVGSGLLPDNVKSLYFDLDGTDLLEADLSGLIFGPGQPSIPYFFDDCIYEAEFIFVSYEDDTPEHYTSVSPPSVPVNSNSPGMNDIYAESGNADEIREYDYDVFPASGASFQFDIRSETGLHSNLAPDPMVVNNNDDDVDALDMIPIYGDWTPCSVWYFSVDHEATSFDPNNGTNLDPATIYLLNAGSGPIPVIDNTHHGLPAGADLDDFEFAWLWDGLANRFGLALLFTVDDDDPLTTEDESGGLDPRMIYYSFLDGNSYPFSANRLKDDVDGLSVWRTSLNGTIADPYPNWFTKTWTGAMNNDWNNQFNWFPQGAPFDPEDVSIPLTVRKPVISVSGMDCRSLFIEPGADVILKSGTNFEVKGQ